MIVNDIWVPVFAEEAIAVIRQVLISSLSAAAFVVAAGIAGQGNAQPYYGHRSYGGGMGYGYGMMGGYGYGGYGAGTTAGGYPSR
jgi:hypothetical protein